VGDVRFIDFKTADNLEAGIEVAQSDSFGDDMAQINGAMVVGRSWGNRDKWIDNRSPHGIITVRTEFFSVKNVRFYNFNFNDAACLGSCSHCWHQQATDSGARTVTF
jgi:hypothetical protein